jgi:hypothetical protein
MATLAFVLWKTACTFLGKNILRIGLEAAMLPECAGCWVFFDKNGPLKYMVNLPGMR